MCNDCGCGLPSGEPLIRAIRQHDHDHDHDHGHSHSHGHEHPHTHEHSHEGHSHSHEHGHEHEHSPAPAARVLDLRQAILEKNDRLAERNRGFFQARGMLALNVLSSPGSGKTTFVQQTINSLKGRMKAGVIVGDLATDNDAQRLKSTGAPVVQVNTGTVCHLEAEMVAKSLKEIDTKGLELLVIENVGNLVCPASYDLGEALRVVLLSVTEGEDKPLKYPPMFASANVAVISKMDLAQVCGFDRELALKNIKRVSPKARIFEVSAKSGQGMEEWIKFLKEEHGKIKS
jgi:hydrogenase nickel incorporation protein HypB